MSAKIQKLFENIKKVPQVPEVVQTIIAQFNDPNVDLKAIARNVEKEQVIALKVLKLVNSAFYSLPKKMASIEDAVVMLGMAQLRTLVIASGIVGAVPEIKNFDTKQFWIDSFTTANYSKWLANELKQDADITFTAGLINGLGVVLLHLGRPKEAVQIEQLIAEGNDCCFVENMRLGFNRYDVSAELCRKWKFPDELVTPVAQCGEPLKFDPVSNIACIIYVARQLSHGKLNEMSHEEIIQSVSNDVSQHLGLTADFFEEKLDQILALDSGLEGLLG